MHQIIFISTQNKQDLRGITNFNNICICFAVRRSVFLSVFNYMLNTSSTQWCKKIKISRKKNICFISTKLLRKTNESPNLETYVVLVSYTLWCFSFLHLRSSICRPLRLPFGSPLWWQYLCAWQKNSHCLRQLYLSTCSTCLLATCLLATCSTCLLATLP